MKLQFGMALAVLSRGVHNLRFLSLLLIVTMLLAFVPVPTVEAADISFIEGLDYAFFAQASSIIRDNWSEDHFASAVIQADGGEMIIDGEKIIEITPPTVNGNSVMLPILDIADAMGLEVTQNDENGEVTVTTDSGEDHTINPAAAQQGGRTRAASSAVRTVLGDGSVEDVYPDGHIEVYTPQVSSAWLEDTLGVSVNVSGDTIVITKPYQTKQLIVQTRKGKKLSDEYGAAASVTNGKGLYFLQYDTEDEAHKAHELYEKSTAVSQVEVNNVVSASDLSWGTSYISAPKMKSKLSGEGKTGGELIVAVVDTGIYVAHPFFAGRLVPGYNFVDNNINPSDGHMHGTHVSGTIIDCTPANVKVMPLKALDDSGNGTDLQASYAIKYAADNGVSIINMSFGSTHSGGCITKDAVAYAVAKGCVAVAAAGNESADTAYACPAGMSETVTVAAVDSSHAIASFSNYGAAVDIAAPGVRITSTSNIGGTRSADGTSMAAPHASAAAAMLRLNNPSLSPDGVKSAIRATAIDAGETGWDIHYGAGILDFRILLGELVPATSISVSQTKINTKFGFNSITDYNLGVTVKPSNATDKSYRTTSSSRLRLLRRGRLLSKALDRLPSHSKQRTGVRRYARLT